MGRSEAKARFINTGLKYDDKVNDNFEAFMVLAKALSDAEAVGFKLDPDSVEKAVKNVLGVNT